MIKDNDTEKMGTYYYKLRNGNLSFEYEIESRLERIEKYVKRQNMDLACGVFSAVIANSLSEVWNHCYSNRLILFIVLMILSYVLLKICFDFIIKACSIFRKILGRNKVTDDEEIQLREFFYKKIINDQAYAISLINRISEMDISEKEDLKAIYVLQGANCLKAIQRNLYLNIFNANSKYRVRILAKSVGLENLLLVIDTNLKYIEKLEALNNEVDLKHEKEKLQEESKSVNEWIKENKK